MELILASGNKHKAQEFQDLFAQAPFKIAATATTLNVVENGSTFYENAFLKAQAYYQKFKAPVLADDSGLNVAALPQELGLKTARFGGDGLSAQERCELLLKKLIDVTSRDAYFICVLCFFLNPDEVFFFEGRLSGSIGHALDGEDGFGYDPVFLPEGLAGKTLAAEAVWKSKHSHRALAVSRALEFFKNWR